MKWIYLLLLCSAPAWGLDVGTQNIIDAYLTPRKHQKAPTGTSKDRITKLRDEVESLSTQSNSLTYRMKETEAPFNKKKTEFEETEKHSSLYTSPTLRKKMTERLRKRCCNSPKIRLSGRRQKSELTTDGKTNTTNIKKTRTTKTRTNKIEGSTHYLRR